MLEGISDVKELVLLSLLLDVASSQARRLLLSTSLPPFFAGVEADLAAADLSPGNLLLALPPGRSRPVSNTVTSKSYSSMFFCLWRVSS